MTADSRRWLVLYCRPRFEFKLNAAITAEGIEVFFPTRVEIRQWSDRKKKITAPLFPGYLFVRVNERERVAALEKPGSISYVKFGGKFAVVSAEVLASLRIAVAEPEQVEVVAGSIKPGRNVMVLDGPFAGMKGMLMEVRGTHRVAIDVEAIDKTVSVEVPYASITLL